MNATSASHHKNDENLKSKLRINGHDIDFKLNSQSSQHNGSHTIDHINVSKLFLVNCQASRTTFKGFFIKHPVYSCSSCNTCFEVSSVFKLIVSKLATVFDLINGWHWVLTVHLMHSIVDCPTVSLSLVWHHSNKRF